MLTRNLLIVREWFEQATKCSLKMPINEITSTFSTQYSFLKCKHYYSAGRINEMERKAMAYNTICKLRELRFL
jgi:hypothetical protein